MRFYFEPEPFTGMTDVISVQSIGMYGDNYFVIEAETEDEAREKLLDLLEKRVWARTSPSGNRRRSQGI